MQTLIQQNVFGLRHLQTMLFVISICSGPLAAKSGAAATMNPPTHEILNQLRSSVEAIVKDVSPSVVQVLVTGFKPLDEGGHSETSMILGKQRGIGSGAIIDPDGYIMTNAHVVSGAHQVQVILSSPSEEDTPSPSDLAPLGRTLDARVIGISSELDLALLKVEAKGLKALPISNYTGLQQGDPVFTFGSPSGLRNSVSMGIVSAVARQLNPDSPLIFIQTDAAINPGNSGGPLVDVNGELVGINTFIFSQSGGNEGLGFAIPSAIVRFAYPQLRQYGHLHRGVIGIHVQTITPALAAGLGLARDWGVIIGDVLPGSPADKVGLKAQDIVLKVNGKQIDSLPLFGISFFLVNPGDRVTMEVLRGTEKLSFAVTVIEQQRGVDKLSDMADPENNLVPKLGIVGLDIDKQVLSLLAPLRQESGVVVVAKMSTGNYGENTLATGDVIHSLNGASVNNLESLNSVLERLKSGSSVVLQVERDERLYYLVNQIE